MLFNSVKPFSLMSIYALVLVVLAIAPASTLAQTGGLTVTIESAEAVTDGAQWRRAGTTAWLDSGVTETDLATGDVMIEFKPVMGWTKPVNQFVTIADGQATSASGIYEVCIGTVSAWGDNRAGQCNVPEPNADYVQVAAGSSHTVGLKADGTLVVWGSNDKGQCDFPGVNGDFIAITAGYHHSLALKSNGSVVAWGDNTYHQCDVPEPNSGFVMISAGEGHNTGLKEDGSIIEWGDHAFGTFAPLTPNTGFVAVTAGYDHSLGLKADGSIVAWGYNLWQQCNVPAPNSGFVAMAAGVYHSMGLKADGSIVTWGYNAEGQCNVPSPNSNFLHMAAGRRHSFGLKADGSVVVWGGNDFGQWSIPEPNNYNAAMDSGYAFGVTIKCGSGFLTVDIEPVEVVAAGAQWSIDDGATWNDSGATASGLDTNDYTVVFKDVAGWAAPENQNVTITTGQQTSLTGSYVTLPPGPLTVAIEPAEAVTAGAKWRRAGTQTWLDSGATETDLAAGSMMIEFKNVMGWVKPLNQFATIADGQATSANGLYTACNGSVVAWGSGTYGQCDVPTPNLDFVQISSGFYHSAGLKADGSIVTWGMNENGQCDVPGLNGDFIAVDAGVRHTLGLKSDGTIVAWGLNEDGQCNVPEPNSGFVAVAGGYKHSIALKADGTVVEWGNHHFTTLKPLTLNAGFVEICAGYDHSLALRADGSIAAWGYNGYHECDVPSPNSGFVSIGVGVLHSFGLKSDGSIAAWGYNSETQCNVPSPNGNYIAVTGGRRHSIGLKNDGSVKTWGLNDYGQCDLPEPNNNFVTIAAGYIHNLALKTGAGLLTVGIEPQAAADAGARWSIDDGVTWLVGGAGAAGLASGDYTVVFKDAFGWTTPEPQTISYTEGDVTSLSAIYEALPSGAISVTIEPAEAVAAGAQWSIDDGATWLDSGATTSGLVAGDYTVTFKDTFGYTSPADQTVSVTWGDSATTTGTYVALSLGSLTVTIEPAGAMAAGAQWSVDGGESWLDSGATASNLAAGDYTLDFKDVAGWETPASQTATVAWGSTTPAAGLYVALPSGSLTVTIEPAEAVAAGAQWRRAGTQTWLDSGVTEMYLASGQYMIEYNRVLGWTKPNNHFVTVNEEETTVAIKSYVICCGPVAYWSSLTYLDFSVPSPNNMFVDVDSGMSHTVGLKLDGTLMTWGPSISSEDAVPEPNSDFAMVSANGYSFLALKTDGSIVAWGENYDHQCDVPLPNSGFVAVSSGFFHSLGLKEDSSIVGWGRNDYGQGDAPSPNTGYVMISAGVVHNLGLLADGSIVGWGKNTLGQCDVPEPNNDFVAVSAGDNHSLGLKADGSIVAWGLNEDGQCNIPDPNNNFIAIDATYKASMGLKSDGSVVVWGNANITDFPMPTSNTGFGDIAMGNEYCLGIKYGGTLRVNIDPQDAIDGGALWSIDSGAQWHDSGDEVVLDPGEYTVDYKEIYLNETPGNQLIAINHNDNTLTTGTYVVMPPGSICMTIEPPEAVASGAKWRRVGETAWINSGSTDTMLNAGIYAIEFKRTPGFDTPEIQNVTVEWDNTSTASASYISLPPGSLTVTIGPAEAVAAGAQWRRVGTEIWLDSGVTETNVPVFDYMIEFKKIDQWKTPSFRMVKVESGQLASTSRDYFPGVGSLLIWGVDQGYGLLDAPEPNAGFVQFDGGWYHSIALKTDGTVVAWGDNTHGQCDIPEPNSDFVQVASNSIQNAGLKADGSVAIWGIKISDGVGSTPTLIYNLPAEENHDFIEMAMGGNFCLGLRNDGSIYAFGENYVGQCDVPEPNSDFMAISAGGMHSLGLKSDGSIVAWGNNDYGQCDVPEPNSDFVAIVADAMHNLALKSDGTVAMWGNNNYDQCTLPVENSDFVTIATSDFFSIGLKSDGSVATFGYYYAPVSIIPEPNSGFLAVEANFRNMIGLKPTGVISTTIEPAGAVAAGAQWSIDGGKTWRDSGASVPNPVGDYTVQFKRVPGYATPASQTVTTNATTPTEVTGTYVALAPGSLTVTIQPAEAVAAGAQWRRVGTDTWRDSGATETGIPVFDYMIEFKNVDYWIKPNFQWLGIESAAETATIGTYRTGVGSLVAWGYSDEGLTDVPEPNGNIMAIAGGMNNLALKTDGLVLAWGIHNGYGGWDVPEPNSDFVAVDSGYFHNIGLKADGSVVAWGYNSDDQCDVPEPNSDFVAISAGRYYSLGLKNDGSIVGWGGNLSDDNGQFDPPENNSDFLAIDAGLTHNLALKSDSSIVAWGENDSGQCDVPEPNVAFVAIAAGYYHSLGLKTDGSIVAWGSNGSGQCNVPEPNSDFVAVTAWYSQSLGLKSDGSIVAWGNIINGEALVPEPNSGYLAIASGYYHNLALKRSGDITVTVEPAGAAAAGAQWSIDGGTHWYDSGMSVPAPVGDYTVTYKDAFGYTTPVDEVVTLTADSPVSITGAYVALPLASISVTIEPSGAVSAGAQWSVDGGTTWLDSGATASELVAGDYTVTFKDTFGYTSPADQAVSVTWGDSATATGSYVVLPLGALTVTIEPAEAVAAGAQWSIDEGATWLDSGATVSDLNAGDYTVTFKDAFGYTTPADQTVAVTWGDNATTTCIYVISPGSLTVTIEPAGAVADGAQWRIAGTLAWYDSGATTTGLTAGDAMIEFKNVPQWIRPHFGWASIQSGQETTVSATYHWGVGSIVAWGWNGYGQCDVPAPNSDFIAFSAGQFHSLGLKSDGSIVAWGDDSYGECNVPSPNSGFVAVSAFSHVSLGLKSDGSIVAWGFNYWDQCDVPEPNSGFVAVAAGKHHSLGLKSDGSVVAWGYKASGQCDVPTPNSGFVAVAAGGYHSLGLKSDGSIVAWGYNVYGQCDVPEPNSGFVAVAAGDYYTLGLKADGSVVAWGYNASGQCDVPEPNSGFVAVSASWYHDLGLTSDGSIVAWGSNTSGQCDVPEPNSDFVAISAGWYHSLGLKPVREIAVTIEPTSALTAGAQWSIDGGATWMDSGDNIAGLAAGDYTVQFKPLDGWITPEPQVVTVVDGPTTEISVSYMRQPIDASVVWVDFNYAGEEWGSEAQPYNTLAEGVTAVASGGTIRIKSGASGTPSRITTPVRIEASGGPVTLGRGPVSVNQAIRPADNSKSGVKATGKTGDLLNQKNAVIEWVEYE